MARHGGAVLSSVGSVTAALRALSIYYNKRQALRGMGKQWRGISSGMASPSAENGGVAAAWATWRGVCRSNAAIGEKMA